MSVAGSVMLVFVKAPRRGQVKSRLAAAVGDDAALALYRDFVRDTLRTVDAVHAPAVICYFPEDAADEMTRWLGPERSYLAQRGRDVGERMEQAFRDIFSRGPSRAVLIGSDIPDLPERVLTEALAALEARDAVIGPAEDGGYYLIGFRKDSFLPEAFTGIPWSTDGVFRVTMAALEKAGRSVHRLPSWRDVDTLDDLDALRQRAEHAGQCESAMALQKEPRPEERDA